MNKKICIITGASSGIGKGAALGIARRGEQVVMVCRNRQKGEAALAAVRQASGSQAVDLLTADLSSLSNVKQLSNDILNRYERVDVLINNAGVYRKNLFLTPDGVEETFAVGYLAAFLLTRELLVTLKSSAPARVINLTSSTQKYSRFEFATAVHPQPYNGVRAYYDCKLAATSAALTWAEMLKDSGVTVNSVTPGAVRSEIIRDFKAARFIWKLIAPLLPDEEKGALPILHLALAPEMAGHTGEHYQRFRQAQPAAQALDAAFRQQLFDDTQRLIENILHQK